MQNHLFESYARARVDETALTTAHRVVPDEWQPPLRGKVYSLSDYVGRTLVALGARFLDDRTLVEALGGTPAPGRAA
jgi:hypothetical protein